MARLRHSAIILAFATAAFWSGRLHSATDEPSGSGDLTQLDAVFGEGLEIYRFGMTPIQVNARLPVHFQTLAWLSMPIAHEYKSNKVRYFWVHLSNFMKIEFIPVFQKEIDIYPLLSLPSCISQASYIVFLFNEQRLFHISLRALSRNDCSNYETLSMA
jgi:hypothetical protein